MLSRRTFVASAVLASLGALGVYEGMLPDAGVGFAVLGGDEPLIVAAVADAFFPPGNPVGVAARDIDLAARVDLLLADALEPQIVLAFRYVLRALEDGTRLSRGTRFSRLDLDTRREVVNVWGDDAVVPRRMALDALKIVLALAWFNEPEVAAALGWTPSCHLGTT